MRREGGEWRSGFRYFIEQMMTRSERSTVGNRRIGKSDERWMESVAIQAIDVQYSYLKSRILRSCCQFESIINHGPIDGCQRHSTSTCSPRGISGTPRDLTRGKSGLAVVAVLFMSSSSSPSLSLPGTTRSRTGLFLSYRDSTARVSRLRHDDTDEQDRLIDSNHIALDVALPPTWFVPWAIYSHLLTI